MKTLAEKKRHCIEADRALQSSAVQAMLRTYVQNLLVAGVEPGELPLVVHELQRVASVVAQTARAQALGIDPAEFCLTHEEAKEQIDELAALYSRPGRTVVIRHVTAPGPDEGMVAE